jgi:predicted flap endonuclease-1-like 5' DNA nuclease
VLALEGEKKLGQDAKLPVRITPSRLFDQPLGKQAIPFYYNLSNSPYSMQYYWDYMSTKHNREDHQLSFFSKEIPGYSNLNSVVHPFVFSLSQYPFYRIEGHTGMPAQDAVTAIKNLRRRYALSFDVISISYSDLLELFDTAEPTLAAHGLEHVCGVQKGYTFVLLHDGETDRQQGNVVADFQIPFMIAFTLKQILSEKGGQKSIASNPANKSNDKEALKTGVVKEVKLIDKIGIAVGKDDLKLIKGIGDKLEDQMNKAGVKTFKQLASLSNDDVKAFATMLGLKDAVIKPTWFAEAKKLMENK